jgi:hypothetical protein
MPLRIASRQARLVVFGYNAVTSRIEWLRSPDGPQYAGDPLSLTGAQVMAFYKDGTASDITAVCGYDPAEGTLLEYGGELNINAAYRDHAGNEFTADTQIMVYDVDQLFFTGLANEVQKEGGALDLSGAVLTARYTDGTTRTVNASNATFEPAAGEIIGHMDTMTIRATWRNPATGSEYSAEYTLNVDAADGIYFIHSPNKTHYAEGEPLDLSGSNIALKYKRSGDMVTVTDQCTFYPENGEIMSPYCTSLHAYYQMPGGNQYEAETLVNVTAETVPIDVIGQIIGEDLGLSFNNDLPPDFWDGFYPQDVPCIPADGDYYLTEDAYSSIVDYLAGKGAFADYRQYGDIPYMILPAGRYVSADGQYSIEARADIYIIAAMMKKDGRPETLPGPSIVDYPYTNLYAYNQIHVLTFTLNASDYIKCNPGLKGGYNSATSGICRKMAGLGLYDVDDDTMYTNYVTFPSDSIVNIPGILALPWCWYDDLPHDLSVLKNIVQHGSAASGCEGITHTGKVPYLTYSKDSLYDEVKEQFPELFTSNVTYGGTEYVKVDG